MLRADLIAPVPELLRRQADARGDQIAYSDASSAVTYSDLLKTTGRLAGHLADRGVAPRQTVGIMLPNCVAWIQTCFGILRAGALSVPISYDATEPEIAYRLDDADCRVVITSDERAELVLRAAGSRPIDLILVDRGPSRHDGVRFADVVGSAPRKAPPDPSGMHEPSFIIYTSGTTGRAKGVLLSQHSMLWVAAACWAPITGLSPDDVVLSPLPLFHSYALNLSVLSVLAVGATEHLVERFSPKETLRLLQNGKYTFMPGVPTMFHYLVQTSEPGGARFPHLRLCVSAGAIMPATLNREFEDRFGVPLLDGYGITETATMVTMNWPTGGRVLGSCGLPVPGLAVRIVDLTGRDVPAGEEGELIVRGPNLMAGYHNKPEETAAALREGWYHTGDLARTDKNGFLTITGRLKELIIRGGQNIAPAEIEEVANLLEDISDCAVVGVPHAHLGEVPVIFVACKQGREMSPASLIEHCKAHLSAYKIPQSVHFVTEIPRTGSGKIMRFKLRALLSE